MLRRKKEKKSAFCKVNKVSVSKNFDFTQADSLCDGESAMESRLCGVGCTASKKSGAQ